MGDMREIKEKLAEWDIKLADVEDLKVLKAQILKDSAFANGVRFGIDLALRFLRLEDVL